VQKAPVFARWLATWFGCGASPIAPGTVGSFGTLPLFWLLDHTGAAVYWLVTLALTIVGTWAAEHTARALGDEDPSSVVIDEVVGTLLALGIAGPGLAAHVAAFVLFRVFDITKPGPVDRVQHLRPAGVGIMADDVLAGVLAGALVRLGVMFFG
jgi:phosphatidylglycerophosphatase A